MARDERRAVKVRDLEGLLRHYKKELDRAHREIAMLNKQLSKNLAAKNGLEGSYVPALEPKIDKNIKCEKCKVGILSQLETKVAGKIKTYLVCKNPQCINRKKV